MHLLEICAVYSYSQYFLLVHKIQFTKRKTNTDSITYVLATIWGVLSYFVVELEVKTATVHRLHYVQVISLASCSNCNFLVFFSIPARSLALLVNKTGCYQPVLFANTPPAIIGFVWNPKNSSYLINASWIIILLIRWIRNVLTHTEGSCMRNREVVSFRVFYQLKWSGDFLVGSGWHLKFVSRRSWKLWPP